MDRLEIINFINGMIDEDGLNFEQYSERLFTLVNDFSLENVKNNILSVGVIPESFQHDSTEEKIYSKYSDILLAKALSYLGIKTKVIKERADSADVEGKARGYTLVADAKVFRLSRTAKNQKDFKVEALNKWKKDKDFACLVAPLYQFPKNQSQIYRQAIDKNVTLLSYTHLYFMLAQKNKFNYKTLWQVGIKLKGEKGANTYWKAIDTILCKILGKSVKDLEKVKQLEFKRLLDTANEEIAYIEGKIEALKSISHKEAIERLIKSEKLDSKIIQIKKIINSLK